jgi:uncharacterized protein (DUF58 family)
LVFLIPLLFILLLLVVISIVMWIFSNGAGQTLQIATVVVFIAAVIAGVMFWRDLPDFKISMQSFMQAKKAGNAVTAIMSGKSNPSALPDVQIKPFTLM